MVKSVQKYQALYVRLEVLFTLLMATFVAQQHKRDLLYRVLTTVHDILTHRLIEFFFYHMYVYMHAFQGQVHFPSSSLLPLKQMSLHNYYLHLD